MLPKLTVLLWFVFQNKFQIRLPEKEKKRKGYKTCILCEVPENVDHVFFQYAMARFICTNFPRKHYGETKWHLACRTS